MDFLQFVPFGPSIPAVLERLGRGLAAIHKRSAEGARRYGFEGRDTYLGGTLQGNAPGSDFASFFVEQRLRPQLERTSLKFQYRYGTTNEASTAVARLYDRLLARAA